MKKGDQVRGLQTPLDKLELNTVGIISSMHKTMENLQSAFQWTMRQIREIEQLKAKKKY